VDSKWPDKLQGVKYWEILVCFDGFQNPISSCRKSRDMGKCRSGANMPEENFNICYVQVNSIATNSKYGYKLSFSLDMLSDFE